MMISREHLELLSQNFRNIDETTKEIINLEAILSLPKGTEHFLSDIHGEYEAFDHILRNGSGVIKEKLKEVFGNRLPKKEMNLLATIIYYYSTFATCISDNLTERLLNSTANDVDTCLLVCVLTLKVLQCFLSTDVSGTTTNNYTLFHCSTSSAECIVNTILLLLHLYYTAQRSF